MRRQLERCIQQARTRKQFGQPIGKFQSVSNRIVDMMIRLETCRCMVYRYAWLKQAGQGRHDRSGDGQAARLGVLRPEQPRRRPDLRRLGLLVEEGLERDLRDSVGGVLFSGTNDIQRNIIAQHLRL